MANSVNATQLEGAEADDALVFAEEALAEVALAEAALAAKALALAPGVVAFCAASRQRPAWRNLVSRSGVFKPKALAR